MTEGGALSSGGAEDEAAAVACFGVVAGGEGYLDAAHGAWAVRGSYYNKGREEKEKRRKEGWKG